MNSLLQGVRVLDLTRMLSGPFASLLLADMGAEVIKIEKPDGGDEIRSMGPPFVDGESAYFLCINRNKKSLTLDLKQPDGQELFYRLVERSDVVLDNFRPGILEKLNCHHERLRRINPAIISCSISGFGQDGPYRNKPAFDLILQALSGLMSLQGEKGRPPVRSGIPIGDLAGAMYGAFAVAAALFRAKTTGRGCYIDIGLMDSVVSLYTYVAQYYFTDGRVPEPFGSKHQSVVPYQVFQTKDIPLAVAVFVEKFWENFCRAIEREELVDDPRFRTGKDRVLNRDQLEPILEETLRQKSGREVLGRLEELGVPSCPVQTLDQVLEDPQVLHRKMVTFMNHPEHGRLRTLGSPIKIRGMEHRPLPAPKLGQHTEEIMKDLLELSDKDIDRLRKQGVI